MKRKSDQAFQFKQFSIAQDRCAMKVGTDGVLLGAWSRVEEAAHILDIGAGTGLIGLMLAQRSDNAKVEAVEIDEAAAEQAKENMENSPWAERLNVTNSSIQQFAEESSNLYDLIVSNPPFFSGGTFSAKEDRNQVRHTVKLPNGDLLQAVRKLLAPNGRFCVILPMLEGLRFQELAQNYRLYCTHTTEVKSRAHKSVERLLMQFEHSPNSLHKDRLVLRESEGEQFTQAYRELTADFYLDF